MDEPLVEMVTGKPQAQLRRLVAGYTGYRIAGARPGVHRGLPSRHLTFIVTLAGTVDLATMPDPAQPPASFTTLVGGLHAAAAQISHDGHQHGIQLHLTPLGARLLLGLPAGELANTVVDLNTLLGPVADELVERLRAARTWTDRFRELDAVLSRVARQRDGPAPEVWWAWQRLTASHGGVGVAALASEVGWSRRHLGARFRREFGLTPKVAARVMRFEVAHRLLRTPLRPGLADVAVRAGFYDQAHLYREWRELAGCTPSRWLAEEFPSVHDGAPEGRTSSTA
ncbi:MAG TPA: helix-turn-helix domain-containing protein [Pseudonocardiaceae bacterium]|nr:helix-turn-helix domain-containing protein [Pseudonocardiaceae bacterium]